MSLQSGGPSRYICYELSNPTLADHGHCQTDCCDLFPKLHFHGESGKYQEIVSAWAKHQTLVIDELSHPEAFSALAPQGDCLASCCNKREQFHAHGDIEQCNRFISKINKAF